MASVVSETDIQVFIGYFEEPEPGVPDGHTGWYHSSGRFPVQSAAQVFACGPSTQGLVRDDVSGPFTCRHEAMADLQACLQQ